MLVAHFSLQVGCLLHPFDTITVLRKRPYEIVSDHPKLVCDVKSVAETLVKFKTLLQRIKRSLGIMEAP